MWKPETNIVSLPLVLSKLLFKKESFLDTVSQVRKTVRLARPRNPPFSVPQHLGYRQVPPHPAFYVDIGDPT